MMELFKPTFDKIAVSVLMLIPIRIVSMLVVSVLNIRNVVIVAIVFLTLWVGLAYPIACLLLYAYKAYINRKTKVDQ